MKDLHVLPDNLPIPVDDGACAHLQGKRLPSITLASTSERNVDLGAEDGFEFANAWKLPSFEYNSSRLLKRLTLVVENGVIHKVFYPVFPPNQNAADVIAWRQQA